VNQDIEQRITQKAYEIWDREGRPDGRSDDHWRQAKQWIEQQAPTDDERDEAQGASDVTTPADRLSGDTRPPN
jgi:alkylhydroperoxidase family enzyme